MKFRKYSGNDKYHFRIYKHSIGHPFIVVAVKEVVKDNKIYIDGYLLTHSLERFMNKPGSYERLTVNPNPRDDRIAFINKFKVYDLPANKFSRPYNTWHLSPKDEELIDRLEKRKRK